MKVACTDQVYGSYTGTLKRIRIGFFGFTRWDVQVERCVTQPSQLAICSPTCYVARKPYPIGSIQNFSADQVKFLNLQAFGDLKEEDMEQALNKVRAEMEAQKSNQTVQIVGAFVMKQIECNPLAAARVLVEGKTIAGSIDKMKQKAQSRQSGGVGVLTDDEGFKIVMEYYQIDAGNASSVAPEASLPGSSMFNVSLDDFL